MKRWMIAMTFSALSLCNYHAMAEQSTIDRIESAAQQLDISTLQNLSANNNRYDAVLAQYRLAISYNFNDQPEKAEATLDEAISKLQALTEQEADNAEAWALLSRLYATKIAFSPMSGVYYGPKAGSSISKARKLAPDNPRVHLIAGVNDYYTPAVFGGSKSAALQALNNAIKHYASDRDSGYHWGLAETYVWRGIVQMELNYPEKARDDWREALAIAPQYGWARMLLNKNP